MTVPWNPLDLMNETPPAGMPATNAQKGGRHRRKTGRRRKTNGMNNGMRKTGRRRTGRRRR
jgi:hypothetical protein